MIVAIRRIMVIMSRSWRSLPTRRRRPLKIDGADELNRAAGNRGSHWKAGGAVPPLGRTLGQLRRGSRE